MKTFKVNELPDYIDYDNRVYEIDTTVKVDYIDGKPCNISTNKAAVLVQCSSSVSSKRTFVYTCVDDISADNVTTIEKIKKGDLFRLVDKNGKHSKAVYTAYGYCRVNRAYEGINYNDVSRAIYKKKGTKVTVEITY